MREFDKIVINMRHKNKESPLDLLWFFVSVIKIKTEISDNFVFRHTVKREMCVFISFIKGYVRRKPLRGNKAFRLFNSLKFDFYRKKTGKFAMIYVKFGCKAVFNWYFIPCFYNGGGFRFSEKICILSLIKRNL